MSRIQSAVNFAKRYFTPLSNTVPFITSLITFKLLTTVEYELTVGISSNVSFKKTLAVVI